jgi:hypothetical protein
MRNFRFTIQIIAIFVIVILVILLAACAPSAASQPGALAVTELAAIQTEPVETPSNPTIEPSATPEKSEVPQASQEPYLLVATWKGKDGQGAASIYPIDSSTGEALPGFEPLLLKENGFVHEFSQDGNRLAVVAFQGQSCDSFSGGSRCRGGRGELHLVDLPAWKDVHAALPVEGFVEALVFSPDASRLALAAKSRDGYDLLILDGITGETLIQRSLEFPAELLAFTADSSSLVVYGTPLIEPAGIAQPDPPRAALLDAASLETRWEQELPEVISGSWCLENCEDSHEMLLFANYQPGIAISPDGQRLYLVHADEDRLTTVDFAAQEVRTTDITEATSWFERLLALTAGVAQAKGGMEGAVKQAALSADGRVLFTAGQAMYAEPDEQYGWTIEEEAFPVQAIELETGRSLASFKPDLQYTNNLRLSPDGAYLVLDGWTGQQQRSAVLEAVSLEPVAEVKRWELQAVLRPDGTLTWLGSRMGSSKTTLAVLDPETFEPMQTWKEYGYWLVP